MAQQQPPPPSPAVQQQVDRQQQQLEQQREEQQRMREEQARKQQEAERERINNSLVPKAPMPLAKTAPRQVTESCLALEMPRDHGFDVKEIPLSDWLAGPETHEIPWKTQIRSPELRIDQRYEIGYFGKIDGRDLKWTGGHQELRYVSGVSGSDGRWLVTPKTAIAAVDQVPEKAFALSFSDCVFLQPGDYVLWMAIADTSSKRHSVIKKNIHIPEWPSGVLPELNRRLPAVEFPQVLGSGQKTIEAFPGTMVLSVDNKKPIKLDVLSILSPADQWLARADIVRAINTRVLSATGLVSQIRPQAGSVSIAAWDLVNRATAFEQNELRELNWMEIASVFIQATDAFKIEVPALQALKEHGTFFRERFRSRLEAQDGSMRVFVLVSGSLAFAEGSDVSPVKWEGECNCRVYHLRLRLNKDDVFDDLGKLIKPLHPTTFDIFSAADFRKALADIVQDLDRI